MYSMRPARAATRAVLYPTPQMPEPEGKPGLHYFDRALGREAVKIQAGEYIATSRDLALVTTLGSCVACCLHDPESQVGGLNHFMLPVAGAGIKAGDSARYGMYAMEVLVNEVMKRGGRRDRLVAKLFGGASVIRGMTSTGVGEGNAAFAREYLQRERIPLLAEDMLGEHPRKVHFLAQSGRVLLRKLPPIGEKAVVEAEERYVHRLQEGTPAGDVELFT